MTVLGYEEKQFFPIYVSKEKFTDFMKLLLMTEGEKTYVLIKNLKYLILDKEAQREKAFLHVLSAVFFKRCS